MTESVALPAYKAGALCPSLKTYIAAAPNHEAQVLASQAPMEVQRIAAARAGFEHWTLRCTSCGRIDQMQVDTDPLNSGALGWIEGELRPQPRMCNNRI